MTENDNEYNNAIVNETNNDNSSTEIEESGTIYLNKAQGIGLAIIKTAPTVLNKAAIALSYLGILAILSYPLLHTLNFFMHFDTFMQSLPLGYTATVKFGDEPWMNQSVLVVFGILCLIVATKLGGWLQKSYSWSSRIFCILLGSGFIYCMMSKAANDMLMLVVSFIVTLFLLALLFPIVLKCTPFGEFLPRNYYEGLFGLFSKLK